MCFFSSDSVISDGETTGDLSDKNCTGDELDADNAHMPKVVSQSNGIGAIKRSVTTEENNIHVKYDEVNLDHHCRETERFERILVFTFCSNICGEEEEETGFA